MAAGVFTVSEILPSGLTGEAFAWTAAETWTLSDTAGARKGGARACPLGSWDQGGQLRSSRTDYTGSAVSEQVLGSMYTPQAFNGKWNDRYNFEGYAQETLKAFRALCERGNLVTISFQGKGYFGLLKEWMFRERRDWDVGYSFKLSIHGSTEELDSGLGLEDLIERKPAEFRDDCDDIIASMVLADSLAPAAAMVPDLADGVTGIAGAVERALDDLDGVLDQRFLNISSPNNPISPFALLGANFRAITDGALAMNDALVQVRSDADLAVTEAKALLDFEEWHRSLRFHSRLLMGQSLEAEASMEAKDHPDVTQLYQAREGESLMAISREVYGTPHQWHTIADANGLSTEVMEGGELLIIPELGGA